MTDYNDGDWHEWYGGECPVHQETEVEAFYRVTTSTETFRKETRHAKNWMWNAPVSSIILYRVVKPYREPRVWWLVLDKWGDVTSTCTSEAEAENQKRYATDPVVVRAMEQPE